MSYFFSKTLFKIDNAFYLFLPCNQGKFGSENYETFMSKKYQQIMLSWWYGGVELSGSAWV